MADGKAPAVDYAKLVGLFSDEHSAKLHDRQMAALQRVARLNSTGFKLSELPQIAQVLEVSAARVSDPASSFVPPVVSLIELCAKPFVIEKANQQYNSAAAISGLLQSLARMLSVNSPIVQQAAMDVLLAFASAGDEDTRDPADARPTVWAHNQGLLLGSGVLTTVVDALRSEVAELLRSDTNADGVVDESEFYRFKVANDADATNDDDTLEARVAREARSKVAGEPKADGKSAEEEPVPDVPYFLLTTVQFLKQVSEYGASASTITRLGALDPCVKVLATVSNFRDEIFLHILDLFWNVLEHSYSVLEHGDVALSLTALLDKHRAANAAFVLGVHDTVAILARLMDTIITNGYRAADKQVRNALLVVATLLARRQENRILFLETGFVDLVLLYATSAEMSLPTDANYRNFATHDADDVEFKQLLWSFVGVVCGVTQTSSSLLRTASTGKRLPRPQHVSADALEHRDAILSSVKSSLFVHTLLLYLDPVHATRHQYIASFSRSQGRALDLLALRLLEWFGPLCPEQFAEASGHQVLLLYVRKHSHMLTIRRPDDDAGDLEDGDADVDRVYHSLRVLKAVVTTLPHSTLLGDMGGVEDLVTIVKGVDLTNAVAPLASTMLKGSTTAAVHVTADSMSPSEVSPLDVVEVVLFLLGRLCDGCKANQTKFRRAGGVALLQPWLRYPTEDGAVPTKPQVVAAAVSAVWNAVVGNKTSESRFIGEGGVDALLDLIECCPRILLPSAVGCLADMLANANVKPYVKVWKSDRTGCSAASLLLRLWREDQEAKSRDLSSGTADMSATARVVAGLMGKVTGATSKSLASTSPADAVLAFDRLRQALKAAKMWKKVVKSKPGSTIKSRVLADDIQPKIFAVLSTLGFDEAEDEVVGNFDDLKPEERALLCLVSRYADFRVGMEWRGVLDRLSAEGVTAIEPDATAAEAEIRACDDAAMEVKDRHDALLDRAADGVREEEAKFVGDVLFRRHAEEEALRLAKRRIGMGSMGLQEWLAAKNRLKRK